MSERACLKRILGVVLVAAFFVGIAITIAAQSSPNTIYACVNPAGIVRIVPPRSACLGSEQAIEWSIAGPQGEPGPAGPPGGDTRPALATSFCNETLLPGQNPVDVMSLTVPRGAWVGHISIHAGPLGTCGGMDPNPGPGLNGGYDCVLAVGGGGGGHPATSSATEFHTLAWSAAFSVGEPTTVSVRCDLFDGTGAGATLSVGAFIVTPVAGGQDQMPPS